MGTGTVSNSFTIIGTMLSILCLLAQSIGDYSYCNIISSSLLILTGDLPFPREMEEEWNREIYVGRDWVKRRKWETVARMKNNKFILKWL